MFKSQVSFQETILLSWRCSSFFCDISWTLAQVVPGLFKTSCTLQELAKISLSRKTNWKVLISFTIEISVDIQLPLKMLSNSPTESFRKLFLGTCQAFTGTLRLNGTTFRPTNLVQKVPPALVRFTSNLNLIAKSTWDLKFEGNHESPFTQIFITNMLWWCRCPHAPNKGGFPLSCLPAGPLHLGWVSTKKKKCTQNLDPPTFFSQNIYQVFFSPDLQRNLLFNRWPWWNSSQIPSDLFLSFFRMLRRSFGIHCVCFLRFQDIHLHLRRNDVQLWHDLRHPEVAGKKTNKKKDEGAVKMLWMRVIMEEFGWMFFF